MLRTVLVLVVVGLGALGQNLPAQSDPTIGWMVFELAPYHIVSGPDKGHGIADRIMALLQDKLPHYKHKVLPDTQPSRQEAMLRDGKQVVGLLLLKTPQREEIALFSLPTLIGSPLALICSRDMWEELGRPAEVSLAGILANPKLVGGLARRAYGPVIDDLLAAPSRSRIVFREGVDQVAGLYQMLLSNRIDWTIAYPLEAGYLAKTNQVEARVVVVPLCELAASEATFAYAVFPKTAWGKTLRDEINRILIAERPGEAYRAAFNEWLDLEARPGFQKIYDRLFLPSR